MKNKNKKFLAIFPFMGKWSVANRIAFLMLLLAFVGILFNALRIVLDYSHPNSQPSNFKTIDSLGFNSIQEQKSDSSLERNQTIQESSTNLHSLIVHAVKNARITISNERVNRVQNTYISAQLEEGQYKIIVETDSLIYIANIYLNNKKYLNIRLRDMKDKNNLTGDIQ
ncbi:MAG TPA: hypothetical protein PLP19_22195 [bacterium]|nr:hypothetical protein [bacterium]HPN46212.1 hypothetical protein [bacterium]